MTDGPATTKRAPRRDAQMRREALLLAAADCFGEHGYDVPLELVAERAGVGRGTLYRNFRDREALALAIFSREIDHFADSVDPDATVRETLGRMVRAGIPVMALYRRIAGELREDNADLPAFEALRARLERIIAPAVARAKDRGELRSTLVPGDVVLAMQMTGGLLMPFMREDEVTMHIDAALALLFSGMRPD